MVPDGLNNHCDDNDNDNENDNDNDDTLSGRTVCHMPYQKLSIWTLTLPIVTLITDISTALDSTATTILCDLFSSLIAHPLRSLIAHTR